MKKVARNKRREGPKLPKAETMEIAVSTSPGDVYEGKISGGTGTKKKNKLKIKKRSKENTKMEDGGHEDVPNSIEVRDDSNLQSDNQDGANSNKKRRKVAKNKKREGAKLPEAETVDSTKQDEGENSAGMRNKKKNKLKKKKRSKENTKVDDSNEVGDDSNQQSGNSKSASQMQNVATLLDDEDDVYQISSGDEDETTGMKRWIAEYHRARPGPEILMQRINDFLVDYWEQKEKERKDKEAEAAEGGWTVVTHVKGRKKTTDVESGTTMGSVAPAAVMDKMSKKKDKQAGLNFYRFQRREAQRNEIMTLQSKFEQDKKRIQQMRAARKFRPY